MVHEWLLCVGLIRSVWARIRRARNEPSAAVPVRLIVGLGNPGNAYAGTRHNIGFRILHRLAERMGGSWHDDDTLEARLSFVELSGQTCALLEPQTFMNKSGRSVARAVGRWPDLDPVDDLLIVYDDMDLAPGRIRLRPSGGAGGHRGIGHILEKLDTKQVPRLRFGVGHPEAGGAVLDWVLADFSAEDEALIQGSIERAVDAIEGCVRDGVAVAMGQFNSSN